MALSMVFIIGLFSTGSEQNLGESLTQDQPITDPPPLRDPSLSLTQDHLPTEPPP